MKGLSQLITHAFLVAFALLILMFVVITFNDIKEDFSGFTENITSNELCSLLVSSIYQVYTTTPNEVNVLSSEKFSQLLLDLPEKIGDEKYRIVFSGNNITIEIGNKEFRCKAGLNASLTGFASGGTIRIYRIYGNNSNEIKIENI